ncbi:energy-coupling factor transporter transmembrane component T family protein [Arthrobacter woluwensis]|uniref:Biotin transport system permease protein n=1 Tax=Arthrobacter woluwensis TaxID=156980 RepID=A0A1H4PH22_9MICC|nr:energy-coupling factor transporter transmembrane protein EcfT [Arthrobacter woluwensis]SEC06709.1 biotin transport system permease protein [Arthrobacter woluwensis]
MSAGRYPLGDYVPGDSWLHRSPLGLKFLGVVLLGLGTFWLKSWIASLAALAVMVLLFASARLGARRLVRLLAGPAPLLLAVLAFQWWQLGPAQAVSIVANVYACIVAASLLTLTTPVPVLLDGVVSAARPLRRWGVDPERLALVIAITLRSIPYLIGTFSTVRDAARARGLERNPRARAMPVLIASVAYAQRTGDALAARGLADAAPNSPLPERQP